MCPGILARTRSRKEVSAGARHNTRSPPDRPRTRAPRSRRLMLAKRNLAQLTALVKTRLKRIQYLPGQISGFLSSFALDLTPFCNPHD
jgi:hypothetical protein